MTAKNTKKPHFWPFLTPFLPPNLKKSSFSWQATKKLWTRQNLSTQTHFDQKWRSTTINSCIKTSILGANDPQKPLKLAQNPIFDPYFMVKWPLQKQILHENPGDLINTPFGTQNWSINSFQQQNFLLSNKKNSIYSLTKNQISIYMLNHSHIQKQKKIKKTHKKKSIYFLHSFFRPLLSHYISLCRQKTLAKKLKNSKKLKKVHFCASRAKKAHTCRILPWKLAKTQS